MNNKFLKLILALSLCLSFSSYAVDSSIESLKEKAMQDDANAQYKLGLLYLKGQEVRQDLKNSLNWFDKACNNGYQKACEMYRELNENNI